jgi:hypothetical protein
MWANIAGVVGTVVAIISLVVALTSTSSPGSSSPGVGAGTATTQASGVEPTTPPATAPGTTQPSVTTPSSRTGIPATVRPTPATGSASASGPTVTATTRTERFSEKPFTLVGNQGIEFQDWFDPYKVEDVPRYGGDVILDPASNQLNYFKNAELDGQRTYGACLAAAASVSGHRNFSELAKDAVFCRRETATVVSFVRITDVSGLPGEPPQLSVLVWFERPA